MGSLPDSVLGSYVSKPCKTCQDFQDTASVRFGFAEAMMLMKAAVLQELC